MRKAWLRAGRRWALVPVALLLLAAPAAAQPGGPSDLVDRLSTRIGGALAVAPDDDTLRTLDAAQPEGERATVIVVVMGVSTDATDLIALTVEMPGPGPRLLLVDAGAVFLAPNGAAYVLVPNQQAILEQPTSTLTFQALPLNPDAEAPPLGTPLTAAWSNDPGLIAVLRIVQHIEAEDSKRLSRYVREKTPGTFEVDTFLDNRDVKLARWMAWSKNPFGRLEARVPRDGLRFAIYAVTAGYTIQETADWLRLHRAMDMQPAIDRAWVIAKQTEYLLERAGLNFGVFSPAHAPFHFNQGVAAYQRNDLEAAAKSFQEAKRLSPRLADAQYNLGVIRYRQGDYAGANEEFKVAGGMDGAGPDVFFNRGAVLYRLGDLLNAARQFRTVLEKNPKDPDAAQWLERADPEGKTKPKPPPKRKRKGRRGKRRR
ncbi:MAG: tetratricopeptide repeat protein [Myxococcales bacterium]|nr:tetratricopeptide repeat protein [Myxococcales bacterium]